MPTDNLNITYFVDGQLNPDTSINEALDVLDVAAGTLLAIDFSSDADLNITAANPKPQQWQHAGFILTDTGVVLTTGRNVVLPNTEKKRYYLVNQTAQTLTLKTSAGTGIAVATNKAACLYCDGTNVIRLTADA